MASNAKVCIIGAGAAGLCAARHLAPFNHLQPIIFEQTDGLGGTWVYSQKVGVDQHGLPIHSSMYRSLKTNLPKEVMAFPDFPFNDKEDESFLHHSQVCSYLRDYTAHYKLDPYIRYNKLVRHIVPSDGNSWNVTSEDLKTGDKSCEQFQAIMVKRYQFYFPTVRTKSLFLIQF